MSKEEQVKPQAVAKSSSPSLFVDEDKNETTANQSRSVNENSSSAIEVSPTPSDQKKKFIRLCDFHKNDPQSPSLLETKEDKNSASQTKKPLEKQQSEFSAPTSINEGNNNIQDIGIRGGGASARLHGKTFKKICRGLFLLGLVDLVAVDVYSHTPHHDTNTVTYGLWIALSLFALAAITYAAEKIHTKYFSNHTPTAT
jgi:hypothetical protein